MTSLILGTDAAERGGEGAFSGGTDGLSGDAEREAATRDERREPSVDGCVDAFLAGSLTLDFEAAAEVVGGGEGIGVGSSCGSGERDGASDRDESESDPAMIHNVGQQKCLVRVNGRLRSSIIASLV